MMNIFKKDPTISESHLPYRRSLLDAGEYCHLLNSQLVTYSNRLAALAYMLGGEYPVPGDSMSPPPDDLIGRLFYDLDFTQQVLNTFGAHLERFEHICGVPKELAPATPAAKPEPPSNGEQLYDPDEATPSA